MTVDATVTGEGNASVGVLNIGDVTLLAGDGNSTWNVNLIYVDAVVSGTGDASVGNVTIGNVSMTAGDDYSLASFSI